MTMTELSLKLKLSYQQLRACLLLLTLIFG